MPIELKGTQVDQAKQESIQAHHAIVHNVREFFMCASDLGLSRECLLVSAREWSRTLPNEFLNAVLAMSTEVGYSTEEILAYNLFGDYVFADGCTSTIVTREASSDDRIYLTKSRDIAPKIYAREIMTAVMIRPSSGYSYVGLRPPGRFWTPMGINCKGLAIETMSWGIRRENIDAKAGRTISGQSSNTWILQNCSTVQQAISAYENGPLGPGKRRAGGFLGITDLESGVYLEPTKDDLAIVEPVHGIAAHTNHALSMTKAQDPTRLTDAYGGTISRYKRAMKS